MRTQTKERLTARILFWGDRGPADRSLNWLQGEFSGEGANRETRRSVPSREPDFGHVPFSMGCRYHPPERRSLVALDFETAMSSLSSEAQHEGSYIRQQMAAYIASVQELNLRSRFAQEMIAPLLRRRDNASLARRIFDIDPLPVVAPGIIYYNSDPEFIGALPVRQDLTVLSADEHLPPDAPRVRGRTISFGTPYGMRSNFSLLYGSQEATPKLLPPLPAWCLPRAWAYNEATGRYALIESTYDQIRANVRYWRKGRLSRKLTLVSSEEFHHHWFPCDRPKMPRTSWWEDLLTDEF